MYYDLIYLAACGINRICPDGAMLSGVDVERLFRISRSHFMDALVGTSLQNAGISTSKDWNEHISKAVRKVILFDTERAKLFSFMEQKGIWYLPLKGIILKDYYPAVGMRQMSDNDILFDYSFCDEIQTYMESQGYEAVFVGVDNHDVYHKGPIYSFELHSALYSETHRDGWAEYYKNVKERLVLCEGTACEYRFTDEDFYVYITSHAYKHYAGSGTGLRTLLDFYAYLKEKPELDFAYIRKECEVLGIAEFEERNRNLCKKVFSGESLKGMEALQQSLSEEEKEMFLYYLTSGTYGTVERGAENRIRKFQKKSGSKSKFRYLLNRVFPSMEVWKYFPFFYRHKWLLPVGWFYRIFRMLFTKTRRRKMIKEIGVVHKIE